MTLPQSYIGVDVSKQWIDVYIPTSRRSKRLPNQRDRLLEWASRHKDSHVVLEATGSYDRALIGCLVETGVCYSRINPLRARQFARSAGLLAKTDGIDARMLSMMGDALHPQPDVPRPPHRDRLMHLQGRRDDIVAMIGAEKCRLSVASDAWIRKDLKASIRSLSRRQAALEKQIAAHIEAHSDLAAQYRQLQSAPGVGAQVAGQLLALLPELGHADRRQIAHLAGLAPHARESGLYKGKRRIRGGRPQVRRSMYIAALVAVRWNDHWKSVYQKMRDDGKAAKTAIIAVARRLLVRLNAMSRTGQTYQA